MASLTENNAVRWEIRQGDLAEYQRYSTLVFRLADNFYTLASKQQAVSKRYLYADNSGAFFMEMKSISYGILGTKVFLRVLDSVRN